MRTPAPLYLTEPGSRIGIKGGHLVLRRPGQDKQRLPKELVSAVLAFGAVALTPSAARYCLLNDVPVTFMTSNGRFLGRLVGDRSDRLSLHQAQFIRAADDVYRLSISRAVIAAKLRSSRYTLRRKSRRGASSDIDAAIRRIRVLEAKAASAQSLARLRGLEGAGAAAYFGCWPILLDGYPLSFAKRSRRPPRDPINALLSFGYALLRQYCFSALSASGLNPYVGLLHEIGAGHDALTSDLLEEMRVWVDRLVLGCVRLRMFHSSDFFETGRSGSGCACVLSTDARRRFVEAFEEFMDREPGLGTLDECYRSIVFSQARLLADSVRTSSSYLPYECR